MQLVVKRSIFAPGRLGGVTHFLYAQQTKKVRGILASDIVGMPANGCEYYIKHDISASREL
jgi:hypothetical protein